MLKVPVNSLSLSIIRCDYHVLNSTLSRKSSHHPFKTYGFSTQTTAAVVKEEPKSKTHGSYHWIIERAISMSLVGLIPAAYIVPHPGIDYALGFLLPVHCHIGFMQVITDYIPKRKSPLLYSVSSNGLRLATLFTIYGLYLLNSQDVGITATIGKLWSLS